MLQFSRDIRAFLDCVICSERKERGVICGQRENTLPSSCSFLTSSLGLLGVLYARCGRLCVCMISGMTHGWMDGWMDGWRVMEQAERFPDNMF